MKILALSVMMALALPAVQGGRKCTNPKGNDGESYSEGCLKMTCKATITTISTTKDGCTTTTVFCQQEDDVATAVLQVDSNCGEHSTEEQAQEIKDLLVQHMEQTDCDKDSPISASTASTTTNSSHGLVISGGYGAYTSVEMFIPSTNHSCTLPSTPDDRNKHTMSGLTICGGRHASTTCLQLSSGEWGVSHFLQTERYSHSSWQSDQQGLILLGGEYRPSSSEVVVQGGESFEMRNKTKHKLIPKTQMGFSLTQNRIANTCAIPDGESVLLTGGRYSMHSVSRYDATGYVAELPRLNIGRMDHGCGTYHRQDGNKVFLVAGGVDNKIISSTEMMMEDSDVWSITSPLPRALHGVRGVTLGNTLYMSGGSHESRAHRDEILAWSEEKMEWEQVGKMKQARSMHAITTINIEEVAAICG